MGEQQDLAQAFLQNQQRASGLRDTSILPDLCASHRYYTRDYRLQYYNAIVEQVTML